MDSFLAWWDSTDLGDDPSTIEKLAKNKQEPITAETAEKLAHDLKAVEYVDCSALTRKGLKNVFDGAVLAALEPPEPWKSRRYLRAAVNVSQSPFCTAGVSIVLKAICLALYCGKPGIRPNLAGVLLECVCPYPTLARCGVLLLFPHPSTAPQTGAPKSRSLLPQPRGVQNIKAHKRGRSLCRVEVPVQFALASRSLKGGKRYSRRVSNMSEPEPDFFPLTPLPRIKSSNARLEFSLLVSILSLWKNKTQPENLAVQTRVKTQPLPSSHPVLQSLFGLWNFLRLIEFVAKNNNDSSLSVEETASVPATQSLLALAPRRTLVSGKPPAIDWAYYKANVAKAGLVDDFEKFNALKIPVPEDKYTVQVDAKEKEDVKSCAESLSLSKARIEEYEKELERRRNIIPFDQMTIEDLNEVFPEIKLDKKNSSQSKTLAPVTTSGQMSGFGILLLAHWSCHMAGGNLKTHGDLEELSLSRGQEQQHGDKSLNFLRPMQSDKSKILLKVFTD
ncbi:hypothetical protein GH733_004856 [Mirounga leonina]|nr:hypothetical protein GH733_004856 [Mirounga leonina]